MEDAKTSFPADWAIEEALKTFNMNPEPLTITITVSGPQGSGKTTLLDAITNLLHDNKLAGRPSVVMPRSCSFRLLQSDDCPDDHTVQFKGFRV